MTFLLRVGDYVNSAELDDSITDRQIFYSADHVSLYTLSIICDKMTYVYVSLQLTWKLLDLLQVQQYKCLSLTYQSKVLWTAHFISLSFYFELVIQILFRYDDSFLIVLVKLVRL